jgi:hypothetical protein
VQDFPPASPLGGRGACPTRIVERELIETVCGKREMKASNHPDDTISMGYIIKWELSFINCE